MEDKENGCKDCKYRGDYKDIDDLWRERCDTCSVGADYEEVEE